MSKAHSVCHGVALATPVRSEDARCAHTLFLCTIVWVEVGDYKNGLKCCSWVSHDGCFVQFCMLRSGRGDFTWADGSSYSGLGSLVYCEIACEMSWFARTVP